MFFSRSALFLFFLISRLRSLSSKLEELSKTLFPLRTLPAIPFQKPAARRPWAGKNAETSKADQLRMVCCGSMARLDAEAFLRLGAEVGGRCGPQLLHLTVAKPMIVQN
jgi:hypothetical protein